VCWSRLERGVELLLGGSGLARVPSQQQSVSPENTKWPHDAAEVERLQGPPLGWEVLGMTVSIWCVDAPGALLES
jgi:hypothetical protein